jgi:hypothetical protein
MGNFRAFSARTAQPNTPETDKKPKVLHKVNVETDKGKVTVLVMSTDPVEAIKDVNNMTQEEFDKLTKI